MTDTFRITAQSILSSLQHDNADDAIQQLCELKDAFYSSIPAKQRISRGITWVVQQIAGLLAAECADLTEIPLLVHSLQKNLEPADHLQGVPLFLITEYGKQHPQQVYSFYAEAAASSEWVIREFAAAAFRPIIAVEPGLVLPWLQQMAVDQNPNVRRFASETLRPVVTNRWLNKQSEYSLSVLRLLFREPHPYPRTSVGNNLSDLSRRNPELIFSIVHELVESQDKNSYWIAYRACRNLVKKDPQRVMDLLGIDEYHYKDRNFYRLH